MIEIATYGEPLDHHTRVADLAAKWLADAGARLQPKTMQGHRSAVSSNIIPTLGKRVVSELRPSDVRRLHAAVFAKGVGAASVAGAHRALSAMLGFAVDEGMIARNVAESVDIPTQAPTNRDSLTRAEARALLDDGDPRWSLSLLSGARDGELRGLRIEDLDLDHGIAHISWNLAEAPSAHGCGGSCRYKRASSCPQRIVDVAPNLESVPLAGRWVLVRPKSYRPRLVPLTPAMTDALRRQVESDGAQNPFGLLWDRPDGLPLTNGDMNRDFRDALERTGITRPATVHWLRHTYTTMAGHAGIPWVVYSRVSGHASEDISRRYTHQLEVEARDGIAKLDTYLHEDR